MQHCHPWQMWAAERGLTGLLLIFLGYFVLLDSLGTSWVDDLAARIFFSLIIIAGVITTFSRWWLGWLTLELAGASLFFGWLAAFRPAVGLAVLNSSLSLVYLGILVAVVIAQVFSAGSITFHQLWSAILIYLFLGVMWAFAYEVLAWILPQAFRLPEQVAGELPAPGADLF